MEHTPGDNARESVITQRGGLTFVRLVALRREKLWVTNLSCVVSSLGSVARGFNNVWPKYLHTPPSEIHAHIANSITISPRLRKAMYVSLDCKYDQRSSSFKEA
ncbi:hypothetical protein PILCRDRAFT_502506 [Piloderma croceum F 1598]|uniref:Uncharacterized protein n=1 Tax=Piloderma croceum (strain F 1598) TaxID=765440 RepID=A0A0C3BUZ7_PILCF|nr:hypothetical protein PILCRDRAFT_502506 [Piloderma croceum F 1598]